MPTTDPQERAGDLPVTRVPSGRGEPLPWPPVVPSAIVRRLPNDEGLEVTFDPPNAFWVPVSRELLLELLREANPTIPVAVTG